MVCPGGFVGKPLATVGTLKLAMVSILVYIHRLPGGGAKVAAFDCAHKFAAIVTPVEMLSKSMVGFLRCSTLRTVPSGGGMVCRNMVAQLESVKGQVS